VFSLPPWFFMAVVIMLAWGIVGLLQKLSTNHLSAESALIWLVVGFLLLQPLFYPGKAILGYPATSLVWALLSGVLNALGSWALLIAMSSGGKASIVAPFTALYPLVVVFLAPMLLHESMTRLQGVGVLCALAAVVLLSL